MTLPEYRDRHLFTARLRLAIFAGFWFFYLYFYHAVLGQLQGVTLIISACFAATTLAYFCILKNRFIGLSFTIQILSDLAALTTVIHLTGGPYSDFFTIYIFYVFIAGVFYDYFVGLLIAFACGVFYGAYLLLSQFGIILALVIDWGDQIPPESHSPQYHYFFWVSFSILAVYGVKVASQFNQKRERMLETRNKELTALAHMSSTIRSTISVEKVLEQILEGIQSGLDLTLSVLVLFDREKGRIRLLAPQNHPAIQKITPILGEPLPAFVFPLEVPENTALQGICRHQIVFRKSLDEVLMGMRPPLAKEVAGQIQKTLGFKKIVGVPLVAESELLGALIGCTRSVHVDPQTVKTLEAFANQAALILEAALLIQRLREANASLKEANRVKSEFLATMSHELRTPLTAIIGFSELLLEGVMGRLTEEQQESLREVLNNGATLLDLINNLLDMAKVEAGKMTLELQPFDLPELLRRLSQTIASLVQRKRHTLKLNLPPRVPPIRADEKKIQHVMLNLLSNAIKFTPEGGTIGIGLKYRGGAFEISVEDNGIGIRRENLGKVFEMFSQGDSSVTRSHGGTGLGLTLARQFVELHRGSISVESEVGKWTRFTVTLPASEVI